MCRKHAGWLDGTERLTSSACAALPGVLLKSPATSMGMSALTAIFSRPFSSVCTCRAEEMHVARVSQGQTQVQASHSNMTVELQCYCFVSILTCLAEARPPPTEHN